MTNLPIKKSNIINLLGIEKAPTEKKEKIIETAASLIEMRVLDRIMGNLEKEKIDKFQNLLEQKDQEKIAEFLKNNDLNIIEMTEEETKKVKKEMIETSRENIEDL